MNLIQAWIRTAGGMKRLPYAMPLPSTVWSCCSWKASTHHYSHFKSAMLCFSLSFWKLRQKHPHASFQMPFACFLLYYTQNEKNPTNQTTNWLAEVRDIFLASKLDCLLFFYCFAFPFFVKLVSLFYKLFGTEVCFFQCYKGPKTV